MNTRHAIKLSVAGKGFSLVELLVVVSVVSLITSILAVSLSASRARAMDVAKIQDVRAISTALVTMKNDFNILPVTQVTVPPPREGYPSITSSMPYVEYDVNPAGFVGILTFLIDGGQLSGLPQNMSRMFYYGGSDYTIVGVKLLETTMAPTTIPPEGTCRPFGVGDDEPFCRNDIANTDYCLCVQ